jgi:hypothetical protein
MTCLSTDMAEPVFDVVSLLLLKESTSCPQLGLRAGSTSTPTGLALASDLLSRRVLGPLCNSGGYNRPLERTILNKSLQSLPASSLGRCANHLGHITAGRDDFSRSSPALPGSDHQGQ